MAYSSLKKRTIKNYQLQFGRTIPTKFFDPPKKLYCEAESNCYMVDPNYSRKVSGKPCEQCEGCDDDSFRMCSHCKGLKRLELRGETFFRPVKFVKSETVLGGICGHYDYTSQWCRPCFLTFAKTDPNFKIFQSVSSKSKSLKEREKDGDELLRMVLKLNGLDLPPSWAHGNVKWWCLSFYKNVFYDNHGRSNNIWNMYLEPKMFYCQNV